MKQRLIYIDVIRGLCIFVVIYTHVIGFGMVDAYPKTFIHGFLTSFFLIMFFFISGMMSYKEGMLADYHSLISYGWKKIRTLLIPSICVMGGYNLIVEGSLRTMLGPWNLWVTWFTYVLFFIAIIFGGCIYLVSKCKGKWVTDICLIGVALICYVLSRRNYADSQFNLIFKFGAILYYLPYFFLGALCKRNSKSMSWLDNKSLYVFAICLLMVFSFSVKAIPLCVKNVLVILTVYYVIKRFTESVIDCGDNTWFESINRGCINFLKVLGQHSLEIYFVHFLLLFSLPSCIGAFLNQLSSDNCWWGHSSVGFVEFCIVGSISAIIAVFSIFFAKIIGQIPYLNQLLFGKIK